MTDYALCQNTVFSLAQHLSYPMRNSPLPSRRESPFALEELFFSTTNKKGVITAGNAVFVRVSGYPIEELLGKPHNIVRHPHMPRAVFKLLWDSLEAGKPLVAYVKNLAKDGSYYWVVALAMPMANGYLSIRFKPSSRFFPLAQEIYQNLCNVEHTYESDGRGWKNGINAAVARLEQLLAAHGFTSYEAFMHAMLREEMKSRQNLFRDAQDSMKLRHGDPVPSGTASQQAVDHLWRVYRQYRAVDNHVTTLFARTDDYVSLQEKLEGKSAFILELANSIRLFALNAAAGAGRLGEQGKTLSTIASQLEEHAQIIADTVAALTKQMFTLGQVFKVVIFDLAMAKLQLDMATVFTSELLHAQGKQTTTHSDSSSHDVTTRIRLLGNIFASTSCKALEVLKTVNQELQQMSDDTEHLQKAVQTLRILYLNGKVVSADLGQHTRFPFILEEMAVQIQRATDELQDLLHSVLTIRNQLIELPSIDSILRSSMQEIEAELTKIENGI